MGSSLFQSLFLLLLTSVTVCMPVYAALKCGIEPTQNMTLHFEDRREYIVWTESKKHYTVAYCLQGCRGGMCCRAISKLPLFSVCATYFYLVF